MVNPLTILIEGNSNPSEMEQYMLYILTCILPLILVFLYNFAFNRASAASFCNLADKRCDQPTKTQDMGKTSVHCAPYDFTKRAPETTKSLEIFNWSIFGIMSALLIGYISLALTIGSANKTPVFYAAIVVGALIVIYSLSAAIDIRVNKNVRRAVIHTGVSLMLVVLSGITIIGTEFDIHPGVLAVFGLAFVVPTLATVLSNKELFDSGYVELPIFKGIANSLFSMNILYMLYLIVALGVLFANNGFNISSLNLADSTIFIVLILLIQMIVHSVFIKKCDKADYNCVPKINAEMVNGDLIYEETCELQTSNTMNLRAARIVLGVFAAILLLVNLLPIVKSVIFIVGNNNNPVYLLPVVMVVIAGVLSYINIGDGKTLQQPEEVETATITNN